MSLRPDDLPLSAVLVRAVVAGVLAGLIVAAFHFVATEPVIDRAITLEEQLSAGQKEEAEPLVSRSTQQGGLFVGFLLYGVTWALFFGVAFHLLQRWLPASSVAQRAMVLAVAAYWSVGLFPFLKYPANPPGVGDPESITYRQGLYVGILLLSLAGTAVAMTVGRSLGGRTSAAWQPWLASVAFLGVFAAAVYAFMPANPDAIRMPAEVVDGFRALSILGTTLFWVVMGGAFAFMAARIRPSRAS